MKKYIKYYDEKIALAGHYFANKKMGMVRSTMGELVEGMLDLIWETEIGGESKQNDYVISTSKSGISLKFQVDRHLYDVNDKLVAMGECKAYLDRCFMERASSDFSRITRGLKNKPTTFILALENGLADSAYRYYMDEGHIHEVFFLCDGKRKGSEPVWHPDHKKPLNKNTLKRFIKFIREYAE